MHGRREGVAHQSDRDACPEVGVPPRVEHRRYHGAEGLREFPVEGRFTSPDPASFDAVMTKVRLGRMILRRTEMTAHRAIIDGRHGTEEPDVLRLLTVQSGTLLAAAPGGRPMRLTAGDAMFTCPKRKYVYQSSGRLVVVAATLPVTSLPTGVRRFERLPVGPLPHSPLVDSVVDLMANLAERLDESWTFDSDYAARGLIDLETAILTEVIGPPEPAAGPDRVYTAALEYIERNLGDTDLTPPQIADALGVSLRYLHRAFDDKEATVARHLRERRLDLVADALRSGPRQPSLAALADRYGFSSQDRLARAFRRRYGVSMSEFRATATPVA
jgi:AraC-like DNA-binding protein